MNAKPQYITDSIGNKTAVILPIADYEELLEDLEDLAAIAERKDDPSESIEQVALELGL
ncbi:hypothetical protein KEF85_04070 [Methylomonas paludis]|uniref:Antitoxin n=1 Tax=Methylomonas paludis TaxID=1173101 RepID=A0A975MQK8_9GAMM|nr:hypothetical protein [Methylomonas paludis]QWF71664.1 hypothetical protein KEF85_04070 [Methylomonas paludis]